MSHLSFVQQAVDGEATLVRFWAWIEDGTIEQTLTLASRIVHDFEPDEPGSDSDPGFGM